MNRPKITRDMIVADVIDKHPELVDVLLDHGIHCFGCGAATKETIGDGYMGHYGADADVDGFIEELNESLIIEMCNVCNDVTSYDEPLFQTLVEGKKRWTCKGCM